MLYIALWLIHSACLTNASSTPCLALHLYPAPGGGVWKLAVYARVRARACVFACAHACSLSLRVRHGSHGQ